MTFDSYPKTQPDSTCEAALAALNLFNKSSFRLPDVMDLMVYRPTLRFDERPSSRWHSGTADVVSIFPNI